jgi:hypothetical protein
MADPFRCVDQGAALRDQRREITLVAGRGGGDDSDPEWLHPFWACKPSRRSWVGLVAPSSLAWVARHAHPFRPPEWRSVEASSWRLRPTDEFGPSGLTSGADGPDAHLARVPLGERIPRTDGSEGGPAEPGVAGPRRRRVINGVPVASVRARPPGSSPWSCTAHVRQTGGGPEPSSTWLLPFPPRGLRVCSEIWGPDGGEVASTLNAIESVGPPAPALPAELSTCGTLGRT